MSFRCNYFAFEHSQAYQKIQFIFLDAVESLDPNNISVSITLNTHLSTFLEEVPANQIRDDRSFLTTDGMGLIPGTSSSAHL